MVTNARIVEVEDVLDFFKSAEDNDVSSLLWFKSNADVSRMMLAWRKLPIRLIGGSKGIPSVPSERWRWLWTNYTLSIIEWCDLAGITDYRYGARLAARILKLRLVFPDNSIAKWADQYITMTALYETTKGTQKQSTTPAKSNKGTPPELDDDEEIDDETDDEDDDE